MKKTLTTVRAAAGVAVLTMLLSPVAAQAATIIAFDQIENGGTVTATGGGNFVGTNIIFEFATTGSSSVFCGIQTIGVGTDTNCLLNFDTAAAGPNFILTAPNGLWDVTGSQLVVGPLTLLTGTFTSFGAIGNIFGGVGVDTKDATMLRLLGVTGVNFTFANTEIRTANGTVTEADLTNTALVPEPGMLAMFGLGLLGVGRRMARRKA